MASINELKGLISAKKGVARSNVFKVELPSLPGASMEEVNLLCRDVQLPGRQMLSHDRMVGIKKETVIYGFEKTDVTMSFLVLNDYGIKKYFDAWQKLAVDFETYEIGYFNEYTRNIKIQQLRKGYNPPIYSTPANLPKLPIDVKYDLSNPVPFLATGQVNTSFVSKEDVIYQCELIDAFPTTITPIQLNNDMDGLVELNVSFSYTNWTSGS